MKRIHVTQWLGALLIVVGTIGLYVKEAHAVADLTARTPGSITLASGTSDYQIDFPNGMKRVTVIPETADIIYHTDPYYRAPYEDQPAYAGDIVTCERQGLTGVYIDRTSATSVFVKWE